MAGHLLYIGGRDADARRIEALLADAGRSAQVHLAAHTDAARALLGTLPPLCCLLVPLGDADAGPWLGLLADSGRAGTPLLAVTNPGDNGLLVRWLETGGDDWLFAPELHGLYARLTRLERERQRLEASRAGERRLLQATFGISSARGELAEVLREVTEAGARSLGIDRCCVVTRDDGDSPLTMADVYDARTGTHGPMQALSASRRRFLETLSAQRLLAVPDVGAHEATRALVDECFGPAGVAAVLGASVTLRGEVVGGLCLEHSAPRAWTPAEQSFARALADRISLALEGAERSLAEAALLKSERRFHEIFQFSNDCILLCRVALDGTVFFEDVNPATEAATGLTRDGLIGQAALNAFTSPTARAMREQFAQCLRSHAPVTWEHPLEVPNGLRWFNTALVPLLDEQGRVQRLAIISRDITQRHEAETLERTLEGQVAEAQKSEALGRVAAHVAHDFNNLLTMVVAHAQRLRDAPGTSAEVSQAILQAASRGRELTQQLATFGRRSPMERRPVDLAALVDETTRLLTPMADRVSIRAEVPPRPVMVSADAGQLHQVLTNLGINALAAMPGGGALTVRLTVVEVDHELAQQHPPLQAGRWARLRVEDTGVGMDEATRRRIFEPFFSRRDDGRGTGLGLAVVQSVVSGHDGAVLVDSAPGRGAIFSVYLPLLEEEATRPGAGQHLMLVDDHPGMARVSARLLETLGYRTSVFDDPREALEAFRAAPQGYDAVLTDLSMPQMSGEDFSRSVRQLRHTVPIIVSSGLAGSLDAGELRRLGFDAVLVKPWRLEDAVATLQRVLR